MYKYICISNNLGLLELQLLYFVQCGNHDVDDLYFLTSAQVSCNNHLY